MLLETVVTVFILNVQELPLKEKLYVVLNNNKPFNHPLYVLMRLVLHVQFSNYSSFSSFFH